MSFAPGHLREHPLPSGIVGALSLSGYQLLVDVGGVGAGRLGPQAFLLIADEEREPMTHVSLHQRALRGERDAAAYVQLAAQLGFLRQTGYRLAAERSGLRSHVHVVDPASGAIVLAVPDKHPGRLFGGGRSVDALLSAARALPPAGPAPDLQDPELLRQVLLSMALADESLSGADAAEAADRAVALMRGDSGLDPARALKAARVERPA